MGMADVEEALGFLARRVEFMRRMIDGNDDDKRHRALEHIYRTMGKGKGFEKEIAAAGGLGGPLLRARARPRARPPFRRWLLSIRREVFCARPRPRSIPPPIPPLSHPF